MRDVVLSLEDVRKHYRRGWHTAAVREDLVRVARLFRGRRPPPRDIIPALDGVSFEIKEGEAFAIIGENGAGKTTVLKIISRITYPTSGRVRVRGRVGALIEVGTGLHPELTGQENIQLYGRILGLSGREIARRFDEIVGFADIGAALDQPVKQYSSGMQLRLGFAVAAHLEPDLLLVDEALAVGDAGFRHRCVERMATLVREGRTLVFISHDMNAVEAVCQRAILLERGTIASEGPASEVVARYLEGVHAARLARDAAVRSVSGEGLTIVRVSLHDEAGAEVQEVESGRQMIVRLHYFAAGPVRRPIFSVGISEGGPRCLTLASMRTERDVPEVIEGEGYVECAFEKLPLHPRAYEVWGSVRGAEGFGDLVGWQRLRIFAVWDAGRSGTPVAPGSLVSPPVKVPYRWGFGPERGSAGHASEAR